MTHAGCIHLRLDQYDEGHNVYVFINPLTAGAVYIRVSIFY